MFDSPLEPMPLVAPSARGVTVGGIKFESHYILDPATVTNTAQCDPDPSDLAFMVSIWEAIVLLPLGQGFVQFGATPAPVYLPQLTVPTQQGSDFADRVLWKRIIHMPFWGLNVGNGVFPQLITSQQLNTDTTPIVVKSKAFLDDKHGLFFVRNIVHDLILDSSAGCQIPLFTDWWGKVFYKPRN